MSVFYCKSLAIPTNISLFFKFSNIIHILKKAFYEDCVFFLFYSRFLHLDFASGDIKNVVDIVINGFVFK